MKAEIETPTEDLAGNLGRGGNQVANGNDDITAKQSERKLGDWGARYLVREGPTGTTVLDTWKLIGEPLPKRGRG
jgi:hypothetical protein